MNDFGKLILGLSLLLPASAPAQEIRPGAPLEREIAAGAAQTYTLPLEGHRFARLAVKQRDVDVVVAVYGQDGSLLTEANKPGEQWVEESIPLLADAPETFRVEVRALPGGADPGHYEIGLEEIRDPRPEDAPRIAAERDEAAADRLSQKRTKESFQQALQTYHSALERWRVLGDEPRQAEVLYQTGYVRRFVGDPTGALEDLGQALDLQKKEGDRAGQAATLNQIGLVHWSQGQTEKARADFEAALALRRETGPPALAGPILNNLGLLHYSAGRLRDALAVFEQAREIFQRAGDRPRESATLDNLGSVHTALGEPLAALGFHEQVLALALATKDPGAQANVLNNLGLIQHQIGDLKGALERYTQAVSLFHQVGDPRREALALNNLGRLYADLGESRQAVETFQTALALSRKAGARSAEAAALLNLGRADSEAGRTREAQESFEQALAIRREAGDRPAEIQVLNSLGLHERRNGQPAEALKVLEQALRIATELGDRPNEMAVRQSLGLAQAAVRDNAAALASFSRARELAQEVHDPAAEAAALQELARVELARGDPQAALARVEPALQIIESLRGQVAADRLRTSYFASRRDAYDLAIEALMSLQASHPEAGYDARAFQVAERARARGLLDLLREGKVEIHAGADAQLLERERALRIEIRAKSERESRLQSEKAPQDQIDEARKEVEALLSDYELVDGRLRAASPRYADLTRPPEVKLADVQRLLGPDTALLEISLGTPRSWAWLVTGDSLSSFELPEQAAITEMAKRAYAALSAPASRETPREDVAELGRVLLAPALDRLEGRRLAVVAGGALQYIPFAALPDPRTGEPLVESREVVNLPSAEVLAELRRSAAGRRQPSLDLAVLADPVFNAGDPRLAQAHKASPAPAMKIAALSPDLERSARDVGSAGFERLAWTRREAEEIAAQAGSRRVLTALDFEASRETATGPAVAGARVVHFATHGFLNSETPELSGLVLSMVDRNGNPTDGFLRLHEVYDLSLAADLVVLSGCRTALGKEVKGEGLLGLTRGFLYAGASRVMASLWPVRDRATAELMRRFYRGLLSDGLPPAAALRAAQRSLRRDPRWRDPFYWAPFILQGDWLAAPR